MVEQKTEAAGTTAPSAGAAQSNSGASLKPKSSAEPIPSIVVKKFYSPEGALLEAGKSYNYIPVEDQPYPWALLRPQDEKLGEQLHAEYRAFKRDKDDKIAANQEAASLVRTLATRL